MEPIMKRLTLAGAGLKPPEKGNQMPKPDLRATDIAPLIAFIDAERKTATR
jgi:hypothetical protein